MRNALFTIFLLQASIAQADIITRCFDLHNDATTDASINSTPVEIPTNDNSKYEAQAFTGEIIASNVSGTTPTINATIQTCESSDAATCYDTPIVFDTCSTGTCYGGIGSQRIDLNKTNVNLRSYFRSKITLTGTSPVYNARVRLCWK
jgi:hypothetical protein